MTTINVRIDDRLKKQAKKTFADLGLDISSAITLFLKQSVREKSLPFTPTANNQRILAKWEAEKHQVLNEGVSYESASDMMRDILGKKYDT